MAKQMCKYGRDELMALLDVFSVSDGAKAKIGAILADENPDAGNFFRYYNPNSRTVEFEERFATHVGSKYVLAVNSGTSALVTALVAAGVGPGDEVIIPAYTFFATCSAVVVAKAIPVIAEIDETLTISPESIEKLITPRTKAIIPVHMLGLPARMDRIMEIAKKHHLTVIEDAAQACGGQYKGKYLGTWGDLGCFSLDAYKLIGSGEGGIVITDSEVLSTRAQSWHDTAACWRPDRYGRERMKGELFCGENYRMNELSAAVALAQLAKLDWIIGSDRKRFKQLKAMIRLPAGVRWITTNDDDGACGYALPMIFDDPEFCVRAQKAKVIGGNALDATHGVRNWHMAWHWDHILEYKSSTADGCPFRCSHVGQLRKYTFDSWPVTKGIIGRMGTVEVNQFMSDSDVEALAKKVTEGLAKC